MLNNPPSFCARLEINPVNGFISERDIKMLKRKALAIGKGTTVLSVGLKNNLKRSIIAGGIEEPEFIVMEGLSYHKGNLDSLDLAVFKKSKNDALIKIKSFNIPGLKKKCDIAADKPQQTPVEIIEQWLNLLLRSLK